MSLFRDEVIANRRQKLQGNVNMALPISWQVIGLLLFASILAAAVFLSLASYSRIETISGEISPNTGITQIIPRRLGVIEWVEIADGEFVSEGDILVKIDTDVAQEGGVTESQTLLDTLNVRESVIKVQQRQVALAASENLSQSRARILGLQADLAGLQEQISVQEGLVTSARDQLDQAKKIAKGGFISTRDIRVREETYLARRQQLTQLRQTSALRQASIEEARRAAKQASASSKGEVAALESQLIDTVQRKNSVSASKSYQIAAPVSGQVTALTANIGQVVSPQAPIMSIIPRFSKLEAKLYAPTEAVAYLDVGNEVTVKIAQLGSVRAEITQIARAPVVQSDANGVPVAAYVVTAKLSRNYVKASGKNERLLAGMALTASIQTRKQSLVRWLFEPLFEVQERP